MRGLDHVVSKPLAGAFCLVGLVSALSQTETLFATTELNAYYFAVGITVLAIPFGFMLAILNQRLQHARIADRMHNYFATAPRGMPNVERSLRTALNDPTLEVAYWSTDSRTYVDSSGRPTGAVDAKRVLSAIEAVDGRPLALVTGDSFPASSQSGAHDGY